MPFAVIIVIIFIVKKPAPLDIVFFQHCSLRITTASYPVPSVCANGQIEDWFNGLADCLHWNVRKPQKPLPSSTSLTSLDSVDFDANK